MKVIAISDLHGSSIWKKIVNKEKDSGLSIFIGDYFDSFDYSPIEQIANFKDIVAFKKGNKDKVVLLIGNHDYMYLKEINDRYSGYNPKFHLQYQYLLEEAIEEDLMQMCYVLKSNGAFYDDFLFVHAGVTKTWCKDNKIDKKNLEKSVNNLFKKNRQAFKFSDKGYSDSGDDICQTPIWVRPASLMEDRIKGYTQIVGHTQIKYINLAKHFILTDCLRFSKEYLQIIDSIVTIKQL